MIVEGVLRNHEYWDSRVELRITNFKQGFDEFRRSRTAKKRQ